MKTCFKENSLDISNIEETVFTFILFPEESEMFLGSLDNTHYLKIFLLFLEDNSIQEIEEIIQNKVDFEGLVFLLQTYWGVRHQDLELLKKRNRDCLRTFDFMLPDYFYTEF